MNKAVISKKDERLLHTKSGNRCALCKSVLVELTGKDLVCIGQNAHICGEKPTAARYNPELSSEFINSEKNLIFLCCNCHKKIDGNEVDYPVDKLHEIKSKHEKWVLESLSMANSKFGFAEIEVLAKYLVNNTSTHDIKYDYDIISVNEKIDKNSLEAVSDKIRMGLSRVNTVRDYINRNPDPCFSKTLTRIMSEKYFELKQSNDSNLEIFQMLWDFAAGYNSDFSYMAAGLCIVTYFFEECEVFEK